MIKYPFKQLIVTHLRQVKRKTLLLRINLILAMINYYVCCDILYALFIGCIAHI